MEDAELLALIPVVDVSPVVVDAVDGLRSGKMNKFVCVLFERGGWMSQEREETRGEERSYGRRGRNRRPPESDRGS